LGVVVCEHADLDLLEVNCVKQCRKDRESLISLLIQSAPNTLIIALFFVMSAVTPTVKTYQGREGSGLVLTETGLAQRITCLQYLV